MQDKGPKEKMGLTNMRGEQIYCLHQGCIKWIKIYLKINMIL
jgi:hypothetical protein